MPPPKQQRRRALELLEASIDGCTEAIMLAYGFKTEFLVELVDAGLARRASSAWSPAGAGSKSPACGLLGLAGGRSRSFDGPDPQARRFLRQLTRFRCYVRRAACDCNGLGNAFQVARPSCGAAACIADDGEPGGSDREHDAVAIVLIIGASRGIGRTTPPRFPVVSPEPRPSPGWGSLHLPRGDWVRFSA